MLPIQHALQEKKNAKRAVQSQRFFKTRPGEYAEGDVFLGLTVPTARAITMQYVNTLTLDDVSQLLASQYHEERFAAVVTLTYWSRKNTYPCETLAQFYLNNIYRINNWDLIDVSAKDVIGRYVFEVLADSPTRKAYLSACIRDNNIWKVRAGVLACFFEIGMGQTDMSMYVANTLVHHPHDLIQKAVGWMLREVGKRVDQKVLCDFLDSHAHDMPRTMLRYAIEHFDKPQRTRYMQMKP